MHIFVSYPYLLGKDVGWQRWVSGPLGCWNRHSHDGRILTANGEERGPVLSNFEDMWLFPRCVSSFVIIKITPTVDVEGINDLTWRKGHDCNT